MTEGCRFCGGKTAPVFEARDENRRVSDQPFHYVKCAACGTVDLLAPPEDLGRYYQNDYYEVPSLEGLTAIAGRSHAKIDVVRRFAPSGRLLEVGPAYGIFAFQAKQAGYQVDVVEMDARCCAFLRDEVGVGVTESDTPHRALADLQPHDVIAIWHAMEHLPQPLAFLEAAAANLAPGGALVIAMPNPDAWQFRMMGRHWPHLDAPRHLSLIPADLVRARAAALGLSEIHFTTDDPEARRWNRFGWQRLLANRVRGRWPQRVMLAAGYGLDLLMWPFDRRPGQGSAYTIVLRKAAA